MIGETRIASLQQSAKFAAIIHSLKLWKAKNTISACLT